jgi:4-hydroxy-2-oxoglutarate aldolase
MRNSRSIGYKCQHYYYSNRHVLSLTLTSIVHPPSQQTMAAPPYGVYTPLVTYFNEDETLDLQTTAQHAVRMAQGGIAGLVLQGSNGEAPHLLHDERQRLISHIRKTLDDNSYTHMVLIVGCAAASVFESLLHIKEAQRSGADFALILPPSYWTAAMNANIIERFFSDVSFLVLW